MSFISLDNISFSYSDIESGQPYKNAVDGVSLNIEKGEFVALLGHNGCGKSTVAKHLNAMLLPDKGKVYVDGDDTSDENKTYDIREKVGLVLQIPTTSLLQALLRKMLLLAPKTSEYRQRRSDRGLMMPSKPLICTITVNTLRSSFRAVRNSVLQLREFLQCNRNA